MVNTESLIEKINSKCKTASGYDTYELKEAVIKYCQTRKICVDSTCWLYIIDSLWCDLDGEIQKLFRSEEEFEEYIKY